MKKERSAFIDILKAIGIISIVIGHGGAVITRFNINMAAFVYTYHLMIFIVTAGYCFKSEQITNPFALIGKRIKGLLPMYVGYSLFCTTNYDLSNTTNKTDCFKKNQEIK